jgi:hypothetical protein
MMYAALAAVLVAGLCWDFGRRWLRSHERAVEAALIRESEMRDEFSHALAKAVHQFGEQYGDLKTVLNLRVRELTDRMGDLGHRCDELQLAIDDMEKRPSEAPDVTALREAIATQEKAIENFWHLVGQTFATKDAVKSVEDKLTTGQAALVATSSSRFRAR